MSTQVTLARPYAKAIFNQARSSHQVEQWSHWLEYLDAVTNNPEMVAFINSPKNSKSRVAEMLVDITGDNIGNEARNLVRLLAMNKRLGIIPDIRMLYEQYRASDEGLINVQVTVPYSLQDHEHNAIVDALQSALSKKVHVDETVDPQILGGLIVRAGDQIIDGSVLGNLKRLEKML